MNARASTLPVSRTASTPEAEFTCNAAPLLLESNGYLRNMLIGLLRDAGADHVMVARRSEAVIEQISEHPPSVIIADWHDHDNPDDDRLKLVRAIRETENAAFRDTPIVFISQPRSRREIERARDAGVSEFLITPIAPVTLQDRLRSLDMSPRTFVNAARFTGPDRRRRPRRAHGPAYKRTADVDAELTTPMAAARAAASALVNETQLTGDRLAIRVGRSLQRFLTTVSDYTPVEAEVVEMHRAALAQLVRMVEDGNPLREPVVTGLEQVVAKRMGRR
ncbi:response regulator [Maricaulis maris]|uniref:response regulator n=1 Tax=Maricaulis maris TaxID=74318 RepID=UPI003B8C3887